MNLNTNNGTIYKRYSLKKCKLLEIQKHLQFYGINKMFLFIIFITFTQK